MDTSFSVPPPSRPLPAAAARPVGDLKRLDGKRSAEAGATPMTNAQWIPHLESQYSAHAALRAPASLREVHAELLAVERADLELGRGLVAAQRLGDRAAAADFGRRATELTERRRALAEAGLPACA